MSLKAELRRIVSDARRQHHDTKGWPDSGCICTTCPSTAGNPMSKSCMAGLDAILPGSSIARLERANNRRCWYDRLVRFTQPFTEA